MRYVLFCMAVFFIGDMGLLWAKPSLDVSGQVRYRFEKQDNFNFKNNVDDEDAMSLVRTRLNLDLGLAEQAKVYVQLQDAKVFGRDGGATNAFDDDVDIRQAYIDLKPYDEWQLKLGRQELSYGDQRLVGAFDWSNVAQSFDAVKIIYKKEELQVDAFYSRKQIIDSSHLNSWDDRDDFMGIYATYKALQDQILDLYYFYRDTDRNLTFGNTSAEMYESTLGFRFKGKDRGIKNLDYTVESAVQWGKFGTQDIEAYMWVLSLGYTFADQAWKPRLGIEWSRGSGDDDLSDSKRKTFDNLYPTNHLFYGYMDRVSLQNSNDYVVALSFNPLKNLLGKVAYHFLYVDKSTDHLYHAGRGILRSSAGAGTGEHIGNELDLLIKWEISKNWQCLMGYSYFWAKEYLADTGGADNGDFFYAQLAFKF